MKWHVRSYVRGGRGPAICIVFAKCTIDTIRSKQFGHPKQMPKQHANYSLFQINVHAFINFRRHSHHTPNTIKVIGGKLIR